MTDSPRIRDGLDNAWAHQHGLDVGRNDIESLDGDDDGFTNLEEFEGQKTDPNDPESHPPFTDKLKLAEVKKDLYILTYRTGDRANGEFGLREETELFQRDPPIEPLRRKSYFLNMGEEAKIDCPYCGRQFVLKADAAAPAGH